MVKNTRVSGRRDIECHVIECHGTEHESVGMKDMRVSW
jgi:hypothetical protein